MRPRVVVSKRAQQDTDEQVAWLQKHASATVAFRFFEAVTQTFDRIAEAPESGWVWESEDPNEAAIAGLRCQRIAGFRNHFVFYRHRRNSVRIQRVMQGTRDLGRIGWAEE